MINSNGNTVSRGNIHSNNRSNINRHTIGNTNRNITIDNHRTIDMYRISKITIPCQNDCSRHWNINCTHNIVIGIDHHS